MAETRTIEGGGMTIAFERLAAGIDVVIEQDAEFIEFSPADARAATVAHAARQMAALSA